MQKLVERARDNAGGLDMEYPAQGADSFALADGLHDVRRKIEVTREGTYVDIGLSTSISRDEDIILITGINDDAPGAFYTYFHSLTSPSSQLQTWA